MAIGSFVFTTSIIIGGVVVYNNQEKIVEGIKSQVIEGVTEILPEMISGVVGGIDIGESLPIPDPTSSSPLPSLPSLPGF